MKVQVRGRGARRWVEFVVIAFGAVFLAIGLFLAGESALFQADAERARGTVVSLEWRNETSGASYKKKGNDKPMAYPVVEFASADGRPRTFRSSTGANPPSYEEGERVEVLYRADSPQDARIDGFASLWLMPLVFGGIGLVIAGIGTAVALAGRRRS